MKTVPAADLARVVTAALLQRGLSEEHAGWVSDALLETSLRGIDTHGVRLFRTYLSELDGGRAKANPELRWLGTARSARTLNAGGALGIVAGRVATAEAVRLAKENGVGAVAVANSNHFGAASVYTLEMARQGVLGFAFTNSDALVAPYNGLQPLFGTNPLSVAVEAEGGDTFCADLATSQVSYSKIKHYQATGLPLEPGWAVAPDGTDSSISGEMSALKPLGGPKGHCLGMTVEILCALLAGMPLDHELSHLYTEPFDAPREVAHFFLALDIPAFRDLGDFRTDLSRLFSLVRTQPSVGGEKVIVPGDLEAESAAARGAQGVPLAEEEWEWFKGLL